MILPSWSYEPIPQPFLIRINDQDDTGILQILHVIRKFLRSLCCQEIYKNIFIENIHRISCGHHPVIKVC